MIEDRRDRMAGSSDRFDQSSLELARLGSIVDAIPEFERDFAPLGSEQASKGRNRRMDAISELADDVSTSVEM